MNQKYRQLASKLLEMAAQEFANHGCNDVDEEVYEGWTREERRQLVRDFEQWNSQGKDYDPEWLHLPDFALMSFFAHLINQGEGDKTSVATDA